jgi:hypothetical protein
MLNRSFMRVGSRLTPLPRIKHETALVRRKRAGAVPFSADTVVQIFHRLVVSCSRPILSSDILFTRLSIWQGVSFALPPGLDIAGRLHRVCSSITV